ncbi:hypothetical protein MCOR14_011584 [Pyricularia oryzae]|nr:hypothetical protein MCOR13_011683 [Pyricularia oryzae]KAI6613541.1 hypothetical protein MCOR14_011584 [Pyricularia oryzae]
MFSSIGDLLREDLPSASFFRMPGKDPKISKKDWVQEFPEVKAGLRDATLSCIEERPGQKYGHLQNLAEDRMKRLTSSTNKDEWSGAKTMGTVTKRLGQEMRGFTRPLEKTSEVKTV